MNRASPIRLRAALEAANRLAKSGIMFVPMPVEDEEEQILRAHEASKRLDQMAKAAEIGKAMKEAK